MKLRGRSIVEPGVMLMRNRSRSVLLSGMVAVTAVCAVRSLGAQATKAPAQTPAKAVPARPAATLPRTARGRPSTIVRARRRSAWCVTDNICQTGISLVGARPTMIVVLGLSSKF